jgi:hypothetical protein
MRTTRPISSPLVTVIDFLGVVGIVGGFAWNGWKTALIVGLLLAVAFVGQAAYRLQREIDDRPTTDELNEVQARLRASEEARRHEAEPPRFELAYDQDNPDPKWPGYARLLLTYNGRTKCDRLVIEELRDPRWSSVVVKSSEAPSTPIRPATRRTYSTGSNPARPGSSASNRTPTASPARYGCA